jgi:UDP-2,3-diacylglucosamine pyrophosphatase LpxH
MKYRSIFISDMHLGTYGCRAENLAFFLKHNTAENLFLVGDVIDGWRLRHRWYFPQSHANVVRRILTAAKRGTNVYYILGNHDEVFRRYLHFGIDIGRIKVANKFDHIGKDGKKYLVVHGDIFDNLMTSHKWLMHVGDVFYDILVRWNIRLNRLRGLLGMKHWSLSKWLKKNTKEALNYIYRYESKVSSHCREEGYDGIICGHIHTPEVRHIDGVLYMNTGDWVESCTALVEHKDGTWELLHFQDFKFEANV